MTQAHNAGSLRPSIATAHVGNILHAARRRLGNSEADIAERVGVTVERYVALESGDAKLTAQLIVALCEALHLKPSELIGSVV